MIRAVLMSFVLSVSMLPGCVDDPDDPSGDQKSGEDDPDYTDPGDHEDDVPAGCRANLQDQTDQDCTPKT